MNVYLSIGWQRNDLVEIGLNTFIFNLQQVQGEDVGRRRKTHTTKTTFKIDVHVSLRGV